MELFRDRLINSEHTGQNRETYTEWSEHITVSRNAFSRGGLAVYVRVNVSPGSSGCATCRHRLMQAGIRGVRAVAAGGGT